MDSLKQFYTILVLFITTALFVVIAANNVYVNKTAQYVYIILFVILYIFIIVCAIKFHKLYFSNRFFVYGAICMVTILFIVLISVNTYMENFVGITLEPSIDGKTQIFSNDMDITYQDDIAEEQIFGNGITIYEKNNVCVTDSNHFGTYNDKHECISPFDEEKREEKKREEEEKKEKEAEEKAKEKAEELKKYCESNYVSDKYPADEYCRDKHNNDNKYGVYKVRPAPLKCIGYQKIQCKRGYENGKKMSNDMALSMTQCHPKNSNFNDICQSVMIKKNISPNTSKYGYKEISQGNCSKYERRAICSSEYYNGVLKTPYYSKCMIGNTNIADSCPSTERDKIDPSIINTDGCNPGYTRYCCNKDKCLEQIAGHLQPKK